MRTSFLVIIGHPNQLIDYYHAIADAYIKGASANTVELKTISIAVLTFSPNLAFGYEKRVELEPDLLDARDKIMWADHLIWVHPFWWGGFPSLMEGFID